MESDQAGPHAALLAEVYQVLGALDAPAHVLDQVSAAVHGRPLPHASLLPFLPPQDDEHLLRMAVRFEVAQDLYVERAMQRDGAVKWAVRYAGECLSRSGQWSYEPMPSDRDEAFLRSFRFDTVHEAIAAARAGFDPVTRRPKDQ